MKKDASSKGTGRRGFLGAAGAVAAAGWPATAPEAAPTKRKVIVVSHSNIPFFAPVRAGFRDFAKLKGWDLQYIEHDTKGGPPNIAEVVRLQAEAIKAEPDALAFTRPNETAFDDNIRRALDKGIPLVLFNDGGVGYKQAGVSAFVGQDFVAAGRVNGTQAAIHAAKLGHRDGVIIVGVSSVGVNAQEERARGTHEGIEAYNRARGTRFVAERLITTNIAAESTARLEARIKALGSRLAGFTSTVSVHGFLSVWLDQNGMKGKIANGGFDLLPGVLEAVRNGGAQWTIGQNPYAQGYVSSALLDMQMEYGFPMYDYDTGAEVVTAANIDKVIKREARFG